MGDLVWVVISKERQHVGPFSKLQHRKVGTCRILHKINENAYQVELPPNLHISNTFKVHHLVPYYAAKDEAT